MPYPLHPCRELKRRGEEAELQLRVVREGDLQGRLEAAEVRARNAATALSRRDAVVKELRERLSAATVQLQQQAGGPGAAGGLGHLGEGVIHGPGAGERGSPGASLGSLASLSAHHQPGQQDAGEVSSGAAGAGGAGGQGAAAAAAAVRAAARLRAEVARKEVALRAALADLERVGAPSCVA